MVTDVYNACFKLKHVGELLKIHALSNAEYTDSPILQKWAIKLQDSFSQVEIELCGENQTWSGSNFGGPGPGKINCQDPDPAWTQSFAS